MQPHATVGAPSPPSPSPVVFNSTVYHVSLVFGPDPPGWRASFKERDVWTLTGTLPGSGAGSVSLHNENGTFPDTTIHFTAPFKTAPSQTERNASAIIGGKPRNGTLTCVEITGQGPVCFMMSWGNIHYPLSGFAQLDQGADPPPLPPPGTCKQYSAVAATGAVTGAFSSGSAINPAKFQLWPSWPASSPWVTAVGATRFIGQRQGGGEMASDQFGSGGGFSALFNQTNTYAWQAKAVAAYVAQGNALPRFPPAGSFPPLGRATPDVSALGEGYQVYEGGAVQSVGGTSASSPMFAALVSLLNEARLKAGKPRMGFLNPFLYANPGAFNDIVNGTNAHPRGQGTVPYGFACAPGWDAATGLGTPKFDKLLAAALAA